MKVKTRLLLHLLVAILIMGCRKENPQNSESKSKSTNTQNTTNATYILISSDDNMLYDTTEIYGEVGKKIVLTLKHTGTMPKHIMGHNVVILKKGVDVIDFAATAATAKNNDYIPVNSDATIAYTKMLGGGEETTIEFTIDKPGTYDFLCSFPAHYRLMKGKLIIKN